MLVMLASGCTWTTAVVKIHNVLCVGVLSKGEQRPHGKGNLDAVIEACPVTLERFQRARELLE